MTQRTEILSGGCQCGSVRFAFYAMPKRVSMCHCRMCQKAVSGPFAAFAEVENSDFAWTRGAPSAFRSSSIAERDFCAACGTPMSYRLIGGNTIELLTGSFDRPGSLVPSTQVGIESKLEWIENIHEMQGKTTEMNAGAEKASSIVSYQHPDHNT